MKQLLRFLEREVTAESFLTRKIALPPWNFSGETISNR
jgi:hypothetical protein